MKARVLKAFHHTDTGRIWLKGEMFVGDDDAAAELGRMGFLDVPGASEPPAVPEGPALATMTVRELSRICAERGIETPAKPKKAELVALIEAAG